MNDVSRTPHIQILAIDGQCFVMARLVVASDKFVRLKLTDAIVEVVRFDANEITINFKGTNLVMQHYEVSGLTPEEAAGAEKRSPGLHLWGQKLFSFI
jgi:hypothetical protein